MGTPSTSVLLRPSSDDHLSKSTVPGNGVNSTNCAKVRSACSASATVASNVSCRSLGSFIFGLPSDRQDTFDATVALAEQADLTFAQFVLLTPFPGTVDFDRWSSEEGRSSTLVDGVPITRYWMIPEETRPKLFTPHPTLSLEEIRVR